MLDKSVPYAGFYMQRAAGAPIASAPLPDGFVFAYFSGGDEESWARIETSVLEFDNEFAALMHFNESFMPFADELRRRCFFIETSDGTKVATATAWWRDIDGERRPWLHWVAVVPQFQGQGLGKALVSRAMELMIELEGDVDIYLHTQTWSYKAIGIYKGNGFLPTNEKKLYKNRNNNYRKALRILAKIEPNYCQ